MRQKFNLISDEPLILSSASGYQLNPELHIMTDYQRFDELVSSAVRASSIINKVDILKNALDTKSMWTSTLILHSIWRIAMNLLADKHKNTVDFDLKSTVFVTLI